MEKSFVQRRLARETRWAVVGVDCGGVCRHDACRFVPEPAWSDGSGLHKLPYGFGMDAPA